MSLRVRTKLAGRYPIKRTWYICRGTYNRGGVVSFFIHGTQESLSIRLSTLSATTMEEDAVGGVINLAE